MFTRIFALLLFLSVISGALIFFQTSEFPEINGQLEFVRIDGEKQAFDNFKGKPLLVTFWSPNCVLCMQDVKHFNKLYQTYQGGKQFELLALSMYYDRPDWVIETRQKARMQYPVYFDLQKKLSIAFGNVVATPTSFLVDRDGRVVYRHEGKLNLPDLERKLQELIKT